MASWVRRLDDHCSPRRGGAILGLSRAPVKLVPIAHVADASVEDGARTNRIPGFSLPHVGQ